MSYKLPELEHPWKWHLDMSNPAKIELWVYEEGNLFRGFSDAQQAVLIDTFDPGINEPSYVARHLANAALNSLDWGSWTEKGRGNQEALSSFLGLA